MEDFVADLRLIWDNAAKYNGPEHDVTKMAYSLSDFFEQRYKAMRESTLLSMIRVHEIDAKEENEAEDDVIIIAL